MSDGLVEALKAAGVPSEQAQGEGYLADPYANERWVDELAFRVAIAADRDAVLRVLLEARLRELDAKTNDDGEIIVNVIVDGVPTRAWAATSQLLSLLGPEGTR